MPIIKMDKITVVGLISEKDSIINALINLGAIELHDENTQETNSDQSETVKKKQDTLSIESTRNDQAIDWSQSCMNQMKNAIALSSKYYNEKKPMFSSKRKISAKLYEEKILKRDEILLKATELQTKESLIANLNAKKTQIAISLDTLIPWKDITFDLAHLETKNTKIWLGTIQNKAIYEKIHNQIKLEISECHVEILSEMEECLQIAIIVMKEYEDKLKQIIGNSDFSLLSIPGAIGTPNNLCKQYIDEISSIDDQIKIHEQTCTAISSDIYEFELLYDYAMISLKKALSHSLLEETKYTFILRGWIPSHLTKEVEMGLRKRFCVAYKHEKTTNKDDYPILLKNHPLVKPYEVITDMFSVPSTADVDPNPIMAPFFLFFFSLMLSDAGYGLLLAGGCSLLIWKFKVTGNLRSMCLLFIQGGIVSAIWGLMFGGFFGNLITIISSGKVSFPILWFNPIENPTKLMIWSMIFGTVHLLAGMATKAYILIVIGKWKDAIFDVISWIMIILGAFGLIAGMILNISVITIIGGILAGVGALIIVIFSGRDSKNPIMRILKGIGGLYGFTGYFGDILSYTRILALSLATGVIAMVVNVLGSIIGFGFAGILLFIVVGILGHALNLAISVLGCYVHTSRLQYVEFFSKFYDGGGRAWNPLSIKTKYTQIE